MLTIVSLQKNEKKKKVVCTACNLTNLLNSEILTALETHTQPCFVLSLLINK